MFPLFPHLFDMKERDRMPWILNFKSAFSLFSFTIIKRLFSSSSQLAIGVVSSEYLRLLIFLPAILISACDSSSLAFCKMYSEFKINKQGNNIQPWCTPFPIWNPVCSSMSGSNCCFLMYIQVSQKAGKVIWYCHFLKNFPQFVMIHIVNDFCIVMKQK